MFQDRKRISPIDLTAKRSYGSSQKLFRHHVGGQEDQGGVRDVGAVGERRGGVQQSSRLEEEREVRGPLGCWAVVEHVSMSTYQHVNMYLKLNKCVQICTLYIIYIVVIGTLEHVIFHVSLRPQQTQQASFPTSSSTH